MEETLNGSINEPTSVPSAGGDSTPESNSNNPFDSFNPNTDGSPFTDSDDVADETADGVEKNSFGGGGSMMNADFSGIDTGVDNTENGNGNNFIGDSEENSGSNNQADGNGNWFYGNDNQAEGNGNWNFGDGNQTNGNGNWNLNKESGTPFNSIFEGENNPLTGGNPQGVGEEGGIPADALGGNNPIFAGGGTTPAPVGEDETPDTAKNPTGNQNTVNGNGNWNFGSSNNTSGNGNWNFGDNNVVTNGNGNRNTGDNNEVNGNGNRPSGNNNNISGNSNSVAGDGNSINGNRFNLDKDNSNITGNADRYLQTDADGNVSLVSDESASDSNYTFDFDGVVGASADSELPGNDNSAGQNIIDGVYGSLSESGTSSLPSGGTGGGAGNGSSNVALGKGDEALTMGGSDAPGDGGESSTMGGEDSTAGGNPFGDGAGGGNPLGGGAPNSNTNSDYDFSTFEQSGEGDPNELIKQSPFGRLLDLPGIDSAEDIFGNVGGGGFGGGADGASNPFANFNPLEEGNPLVEGDEPDVSFGGAGNGAGNAAPGKGGKPNSMDGDNAPDEDSGNSRMGGDRSTGGSSPLGSNAGGAVGGNPFEFDPTADSSNSSDIPSGNTFLKGEVPEGLSDEELAVSSGVADSEDAPAENNSSPGDNSMESNSNYNWDFDFADFGSLNQDSSSDGGASEPADEEPLFDEIDFQNLQANDGENTNASVSEVPIFNAETNELLLPNGVKVNPSNEDGELDISLEAPVFNEDGSEAGNLKISFPDFVEDYYSSVFNSDDMIEVFRGSGSEIFSSEISDIEGNSNLFGIDTPVLGEDNVLQVPGGFEIDLSGIMGDM